MQQEVRERFGREFGAGPEHFVLSPGRVNLIGEYTDYNNGYVLPMAIDRCLVIGVSRRSDYLVRVFSADFQESIEFSLAALEKGQFTWGEYVTGCMAGLLQGGHQLSGYDAVIVGNIPVGASLSSSAALELGVLRAASYSSGLPWDPVAMARLGQRAENQWVGMNCGIMDQAVCSCGKKDHALLIDCKDLSMRLCPLPGGSSIVILDTTTRRGLVDSAYNERRQQCVRAASVLGVESLREVDEKMLEQNRNRLSALEYLRARHIVRENGRVLKAAAAMEAGWDGELGRLMYESHCSLRDDYDVSGAALNRIVECAMAHGGCLGARMTGAGFAGCAVALVKRGAEEDFMNSVVRRYRRQIGCEPRLYLCRAADGTRITAV